VALGCLIEPLSNIELNQLAIQELSFFFFFFDKIQELSLF